MCSSLKKCVVIFLLFVVFSAVTEAATQAGEAKQMVFYPTDVTEAGDLTYLRDSIRLMLASRLASVAGVQVRLEKKMDKTKKSGVYRVTSRLTSTKAEVALSASVFVPSAASPLHFRSVANDSEGIMQALDMLVADMAKSLFDVPDSPVKKEELGEKTDKETDLSTSHPDRAIKANSGFGLSISQEGFATQTPVEVRITERYKSSVIPVTSQGMTAGDIDGDALDEILVSSHGKLFIYQLRDQRIQLLSTIALPGGLRVHALNVADLDNDGVMEIYLSSTRDKQPLSFVLQWQPSTGAKWLHENVPWHIRPLDIPGEGWVLAGQQSGLESMMMPGIYRVISRPGERLSKGELLPLPESVNLFDFVFADLDGDRALEVVHINSKEQLQVFDADMQLLYTSPSGFGGRELSRGLTVPIRLVVTDFDANGKQDILIVDNELYSPKIFSNTRLYRNGQIRGLLWDGTGFMEMWHTNVIPTAVVDFQFLSFTGAAETGNRMMGRLFVVEPEKGDFLQGFVLGVGGSRLSVYGIDFIDKGDLAEE